MDITPSRQRLDALANSRHWLGASVGCFLLFFAGQYLLGLTQKGFAQPGEAAALPNPVESKADPVIAAAGDIACSPSEQRANTSAVACQMLATSNLLIGKNFKAVLALGDLQYPAGTLADFQATYAPTWGRLKALTQPVPGNHEYGTPRAAGYFRYFGAIAHQDTQGYYSYNLGRWHLIALNSNCSDVGGCGVGSPQEKWLKADLAANKTMCTLAYWHHSRFSSALHGNNADYDAFWQDLYAAGVDLILNGHDHNYERFAPQTPAGVADPKRGIREFVVGTGGRNLYPFKQIRANSELRDNQTFGVLSLTLHPTGYDWQFLPIAGQTFTDSGSQACH
jgi:hypothetical protein